MPEDFVESYKISRNLEYENNLRPEGLSEFIGQENIHKQLEILIGAAKQRNEAVGHCLFSGPPGLGKTTLAHIISKAMDSNITVTSGPVLEKPSDLAGILTNLQNTDVLFIDEIHRLAKCIEEYLYPAMEDFCLDLLIDSGPNARSVKIKLNRFTLVGATTKIGLISNPMRSRFNFNGRLDYYSPNTLRKIIFRSSKILNLKINDKATLLIAKRSRGTPRIANNLLKWVRDFAQMNAISEIDENCVNKALDLLSIDHEGLDIIDKKILNTIIDFYDGGPVGIQTIAASIGEETSTLTEVYEPYLMQKGFIKRTKRGREATKLAYEHMDKKQKN